MMAFSLRPEPPTQGWKVKNRRKVGFFTSWFRPPFKWIPNSKFTPITFFCAYTFVKSYMFLTYPLRRETLPATIRSAICHLPIQLFKILADETRLGIVLLLSELGELCVCDLCTALDQSQPKISRHLALLRERGLLLDRKQGKWVH